VDRLLWKTDVTVQQWQKMHGLQETRAFDATKELVLSQEDAPAPEIHGTVRHFEQ